MYSESKQAGELNRAYPNDYEVYICQRNKDSGKRAVSEGPQAAGRFTSHQNATPITPE
jgi:hypothetical protein